MAILLFAALSILIRRPRKLSYNLLTKRNTGERRKLCILVRENQKMSKELNLAGKSLWQEDGKLFPGVVEINHSPKSNRTVNPFQHKAFS
jgi:hypothetical protein